jgi:phenylacetic acid degradation operon negative regulatory protein
MKARSSLFTLFGEFVHPRGNVVWVGTMIAWMQALGFSEAAVRAAVSRSQRTGWLSVQKIGRKSYYALTPEVRWRVHNAVGRLYQPLEQHWDGRWRLLTYSIPESHKEARDQFRKELLILGFGAWQNGVWLSPNDTTESALALAAAHHLEPFVDVFVAERFGQHSSLEVVGQVWDVAALNARFDEFLRAFSSFALPDTPKPAFCAYVQMLHEYRKFLFLAPDLPLELQPVVWRVREAALLFREHKARLEPLVTEFVKATFVTTVTQNT